MPPSTPEREQLDRLEAVFFEAMDLHDDERSAFLEGACAGDAQLRIAVDKLIRADRIQGSLIERSISPRTHPP